MPVCVHCSFPTSQLYQHYGKDHLVLNQCTKCNQFCDPYLEQDGIVIFIDLVLHKPQVYRHLIFNRLEYCDRGFQPIILKLGLLISMFNVYIKWFQIERFCHFNHCQWLLTPPLIQYFQILGFSIIESIVFISIITLCVYLTMPRNITLFKYNYLVVSIIISSFSKLLLIAMVIWNYHHIEYSWLLTVMSMTSNWVAITTFLQFEYYTTSIMILTGLLGKLGLNWLLAVYLIEEPELIQIVTECGAPFQDLVIWLVVINSTPETLMVSLCIDFYEWFTIIKILVKKLNFKIS